MFTCLAYHASLLLKDYGSACCNVSWYILWYRKVPGQQKNNYLLSSELEIYSRVLQKKSEARSLHPRHHQNFFR